MVNEKNEEEKNGVGPVDNRPSTDKLNHSVKKNVTCHMSHVTCYT